MPTPEVPTPQVQERPESPAISEKLQQATGVQPAPVNPQTVNDASGNPITQTSDQSAKIQIPSDRKGLIKKARGSITNAATWLARFFLRVIAKQNANN